MAAGCTAAGMATGGDNATECAALIAAYAAWGNKPTNWAAGIKSGSSYCAWGSAIECIGGRVVVLCAQHF